MNEVVEKDYFQEKFNPKVLDLFKTEEGEPHLTTHEGVTMRVASAELKELLWKTHYQAYGREPTCCLVNQTIKKLFMFGRTLAPVKKVHRRVAGDENTITIDRSEADGTAIKITDKSVTVGPNQDVKFIRTKGQRALVAPALDSEPHNLELLRHYINFQEEKDFILFVAWLVGCLNPHGGFAVLFLGGEQGAGKSSACRIIKSLLDPSSAVLMNFPKTERGLMIAAVNDFILCFDNTSKITDSQSDSVCKLVLGTTFATRRLYSTAAQAQFFSKNPCAINGIDCLPTRQDLLDRSLIVNLDFILPKHRKTEKELMESWEHDRPLILGALCQAASAALRNYDSISERNLPRMADFAKWILAAEEMLPWPKGGFMEAMKNLRANVVAEALDADPVTMAVLRLMEYRDSWTGSATDLIDVLGDCIDQNRRKYPGFPKVPNQLSQKLNRVSAFLREKGVLFQKSHSGTRSITLSKIDPIEAQAGRKGTYATNPQEAMDVVHRDLPAGSPQPSYAPQPDESEDSAEIQASTMVEADF